MENPDGKGICFALYSPRRNFGIINKREENGRTENRKFLSGRCLL
jgi:hypothetical protein